ncbi:MAG TPA: glycosyltransferase, partial [Magnetospirillaceae bacterium]|nr:glycosyltransferase [Magnetospirillaceae bacterium]
SQGIGKVFAFAQALYLFQTPVNIIAVSGRNKATLRRLDVMRRRIPSRTRLAPLGYVTNMNELMAASDVVVGKAGASTAMEAIFLGKPLIFTEWAAYNDRFIIRFALEYLVGWYCPTVFSFSRLVRKISKTDVLEEYRLNVKNLAFEPGTDEVADFLLRFAETRTSREGFYQTVHF